MCEKDLFKDYSPAEKLEIICRSFGLPEKKLKTWCLANGIEFLILEKWKKNALCGLSENLEKSFEKILFENRKLKEKIKTFEQTVSEPDIIPVCFF